MTRPSLVLAALLLLAACSPPPPAPTATPTATLVPDVGYPQSPPDMAAGAQIFAKRCTPCHGELGLGDGPLVRAEAVPAPPRLAAWETGWSKTPAERFAFITNGNMDKMMPPWNEALSEPERWAVALFTYTLHTPPEQLLQGQALWQDECASCHGAGGAGTTDAAVDLSDPRRMIAFSDESLNNSMTAGLADGSHTFSHLTDDQHRALVAYTRSLSVANPDAIGRPLPAEVTAQ